MIKDFQPRLYQQSIFATCATRNTLVVLPTGMGKTNIFLMMASHRLTQYPESKILLIGPTRPLIDQYHEVFKKHFELPEKDMCILTGKVQPDKRKELWEKSRIIFSTPQGLENDLITRRISLEPVSLLGVDEAHRAVGDYSYVWIAEQYQKNSMHPRIIGLTASPGSEMESIHEVCRNLFLEEIEARSYNDPDVAPYVKEIEIEWKHVEMGGELVEIKKILDSCLKERMQKIEKWNLLRAGNPSKKELLELQASLHGRIARGEKDFAAWNAISLIAETIKIYHASELLETQGISPLHKYFERLSSEKKKSKASKNLDNDQNFRQAIEKTANLFQKGVEHPKLDALASIIKNEAKPDTKIIIFTQYRDSAVKIASEMNQISGINARIFVGQAKKRDTGMSQKQQKQMLDEFREGAFNVLCATSIGEEGLDIPRVDIVIFYEPIPSAIRHIQRRGRTGRQEKGRVIVLVTKNTRDEAFRWVAHRKEKMMYHNIKKLKGKITSEPKQKNNENLDKFMKKALIFADSREQGSQVLKRLSDNAEINLQRLECADYICSSRAGIETKKNGDFVNSIIDGRLLSQARELKSRFERPIMIIEGDEDIYSIRNVSPEAIRGMIATIALSYGIPLIQTRNANETADMILAIARREQETSGNNYTPHKNKPITTKEMQEYIVSSLPMIGPMAAKPLLEKFRTVKNVINANEEDLKRVELIGDKKAKEIRNVLDSEYIT
ncbi:DEAD/DEAH box helicase [Candidatus Woesearchaeota archaeon]|nr:DEAD/DEAH box helicase [Candidatus Woesearchaeota archaeon]